MSDFRVIDRRSDDEQPRQPQQEECGGECGGCNGCGVPMSQAVNPDELWQSGAFAVSKLSGVKLMILKAQMDDGGQVMYICRGPDLQVIQMCDFELELIDEEE